MAMAEIRGQMPRQREADHATEPAPVAIKALLRVFAAWRLNGEASAALSGTSNRTWARMRSGTWSGTLGQDRTLRASGIIGIYKGLHLYFGDDLADEWVTLANQGPLFQGRSPLDHMIAGGLPAIIATRNYVDALRGGL